MNNNNYNKITVVFNPNPSGEILTNLKSSGKKCFEKSSLIAVNKIKLTNFN